MSKEEAQAPSDKAIHETIALINKNIEEFKKNDQADSAYRYQMVLYHVLKARMEEWWL